MTWPASGLERLKSGGQRRCRRWPNSAWSTWATCSPTTRGATWIAAAAAVGELEVGEDAMVLATVERVRTIAGRNRRARVEVLVSDREGARLNCVFFNQPWRAKQLREGMGAVLYGRLEEFRGAVQMTNPVVDLVGDRTGGIFAVYPLSAKAAITTWEIGDMVGEALRRCAHRGIADPVPPSCWSPTGCAGATRRCA